MARAYQRKTKVSIKSKPTKGRRVKCNMCRGTGYVTKKK